MLASAFISLWISNAATTMMMLPIGLAVIQQLEREKAGEWTSSFAIAVMLGIAYASSIGGVGTIVGTAPAAVTFLTEFMSNPALTLLMTPVLALAATSALHLHPFYVLIPATLSASLGFMMPAGTPPNALVFGSGYVTIPQMMRTGFLLNVLGVALVTLLAYFVIPAVFGINDLSAIPGWARK